MRWKWQPTKACDGDDPSPGGAGERTPVWTKWNKRVPPPPAANPAPDPLIPADDLGLAGEPPRVLLQALGMAPEGGGYLASRLAQLAAALGGESTQAATLAPFLTATSASPPPDGSPSYLSQFLAGLTAIVAVPTESLPPACEAAREQLAIQPVGVPTAPPITLGDVLRRQLMLVPPDGEDSSVSLICGQSDDGSLALDPSRPS